MTLLLQKLYIRIENNKEAIHMEDPTAWSYRDLVKWARNGNNGINADKVGGNTITDINNARASAINSHAASRNHPVATQTANGLMTAADKLKLDGLSGGGSGTVVAAGLYSTIMLLDIVPYKQIITINNAAIQDGDVAVAGISSTLLIAPQVYPPGGVINAKATTGVLTIEIVYIATPGNNSTQMELNYIVTRP